MIVMQCEAQLFQIVGALRAASRFPGSLYRGQQESNQDADNGDHHKQFDKGERCAVCGS